MNTNRFHGWLDWLIGRPHFLLAGHLAILHILSFGGWQVAADRLLWMAALGLFLLWQPFVAGKRNLPFWQGVALLVLAWLSGWLLGPWLLLTWSAVLAAAIGSRVMASGRRGERAGYVWALVYLIVLGVLGVLPETSSATALDPGLRAVLARFLPLALPCLLLFPARAPERHSAGGFELLYGMLLFLVLVAFILGALAYMTIGGAAYVEALFKASLTMAAALLLLAWAWNPRAGFGGIGAAFSHYLLSVGMPLDQWLLHLSRASEENAGPDAFLEAALGRLPAVPWMLGVAWAGEGRPASLVGGDSRWPHRYRTGGLDFTVYFRQTPSPTLRWHVDCLLRLAAEFYQVKRQSALLERMGYARAIYETGARVTHDVKNLLQSLQGLCYAASQPGDPAEVAALLRRQLPQIKDRLGATLDKLKSPSAEAVERVDALAWWRGLPDRYAHANLSWSGRPRRGERIPAALFDSAVENLVQNALAKRQREPGLNITVAFCDGEVSVTDDGRAVPPALAERLPHEPLRSENGLGVGLFHVARYAESQGYRLSLAVNRDGEVRFALLPGPSA